MQQDMILYLEKTVDFPQHTQMIKTDTSSKVASYKINMQISVSFPYSNDKLCEKEINKTVTFTEQWNTKK